MKNKEYIFTSERLGFRNWRDKDVAQFAAMNANEEVMHYFESTISYSETADKIKAMQDLYADSGFCYFAVEILETGEFIGCIGFGRKDFESDFTPMVDIGWRLNKPFWGRGYATEGAKRCLEYGFEALELETIYAIAPEINKPSIAVMEKIGMKFDQSFNHPHLENDGRLNPCLAYLISKDSI